MAIRIVQSKQNGRLKELRAALVRPGRQGSGLIALEGMHLLTEAVSSHIELETIFVSEGSEKLLEGLPIAHSVEILTLPHEVLASAVTTETPQPIAALVRPRQWTWAETTQHYSQQQESSPPLLIVLAGIQDPGNLGTILRSAEAFGAHGVLSLPGTVTCWNPKAMRASAGSVFRLPLLSVSEEEAFGLLDETEIGTVAAMPHNASPAHELDLTRSTALFIGAEGSGLSEQLASRCDARVSIPCPGPVESLNAAVAATILLYEASRQRDSRERPAATLPVRRKRPA